MSGRSDDGGARSGRRRLRLALALAAAAVACSRGGEPAPQEPAAPAATPPSAPVSEAGYVGSETCAACHPVEAARWRGSQHQRAMQPARADTVLGDFADARFREGGATTKFLRDGARFVIETQGADGRPGRFEAAYTFGVDPLQQLLVAFPDGRLQALTVAWDTRPRARGGQRWFSLYPGQRIAPGSPLHWTGLDQNWNHMCAECHSTHVVKGYLPESDRFDTRWSEIDVGCEACHGPGARHADRARRGALAPGDAGLAVDLRRGAGHWVLGAGERIAHRSEPLPSHAELDTCAPCHSRRGGLTGESQPGRAFLDGYRPALLDEGLYQADGQILGEVYVWGSFLQSAMYAAGVTCSDCHEPHALALRASGNALCTRCHRPEAFDVPAHHHHREGAPGARCVDCHMPARTYMEVDPRRDHSFRVPRPDLSRRLGTSNACTGCHGDHDADWAAGVVAAWFPQPRARGPHYGEAIAAGRRGAVDAPQRLAALADDAAQPGIARATAVRLAAEMPDRGTPALLERAVGDADPLVRLAAAGGLAALDPRLRARVGAPLLRDATLAVRLEAASALASVPAPLWPSGGRSDLARALAEYRAAQRAGADRPEAHLNLGTLHAEFGEADEARAEYETALRLDPTFAPAAVNLADLLRAQGRDAEGERVLRALLERVPDDAAAEHALGLLLVREGRKPEALDHLRRAAELAPGNARLAYVYAIALQDAGRADEAARVLERAHERRPVDRDLLAALVAVLRDRGDLDAARAAARELARLAPDDPGVAALLRELGGS